MQKCIPDHHPVLAHCNWPAIVDVDVRADPAVAEYAMLWDRPTKTLGENWPLFAEKEIPFRLWLPQQPVCACGPLQRPLPTWPRQDIHTRQHPD